MSSKRLDNKEKFDISGGFTNIPQLQLKGGPIFRICTMCGQRFQAGNAGVNHKEYPLKTVCPKCLRIKNVIF